MSEPSGPQWCLRFPGSSKTSDLLPEFRDRVDAFISVIQNGNAQVRVSATYRPPERAYLMHWSYGIARGLPANMCRPQDTPNVPIDPASVPPMSGVAIDWTHGGNLSEARSAAMQMVSGYQLQYAASLTSNHTKRRAVDMTIGWDGTLNVRDFDGVLHHIASAPHNGTNPELVAVGKTFGVLKLTSDPPHWSDDGH